MDSPQSSNKAMIGIVVVVLLMIAATAVVVTTSNNQPAAESAVTASDTPLRISTSSSPTSVDGPFKDGTYSASASYESPGGTESIDVTVTLASDTVTSVSATPHANVREAAEYQSKFISGYKSKVVGKKINEISLSRVAGSSLTSIGFNSALADIANQARS